jgi:integrase
VVPLLQEQSARQLPEGWVFARHDGKKPILIDAAFVIARKRAGLDNFHFHDLRHTCASYLVMSGASLRAVAEVLGHKNIQQTFKYAHMSQSHTAGVLSKMADAFLQPAPGPTER